MSENKTPSQHLKSFFSNSNIGFDDKKSIQKNFKFIVDFDLKDSNGKTLTIKDSNNSGEVALISAPNIKPWHILKCSFPISYGWESENFKIGPYSYSYPKLNHTGFDIDMTMEEDESGTIAFFAHFLQTMMIGDKGSNGNYIAQTKNRIPAITINIFDDYGKKFMTVVYKKAYFQKCDLLSLDYDAADSIKYSFSFHSDFMEIDYNKQNRAQIGGFNDNAGNVINGAAINTNIPQTESPFA